MFLHNFKYFFKTLLKNKALLFWTFAFPILLGTFFNLAFSDIENNEKLNIIDIAVINNDKFNSNENIIYKEALISLSKKDKNQIFNIKYVTKEKAKELLDKNKITGYVEFNDKPVITVMSDGINETIIKTVINEITSSKQMMNNIALKEIGQGNYNIDYAKIYNEIIQMQNESNINNISNKNLSYTMIEFYTLIAMACLYGGMLGITVINYSLANMSNKGKRITMSSAKKSTIILSSVCASYIVQLVGVFILLLYTIFVLNVDYGDNIPLIILMVIVGSLAGLTLGVLIGTISNKNENTKTGILISITMACSFFSGMMGITMKYIIDKNIPLLNKINPANMITDGFYSLYYYDSLNRYYFNVISLLLFSLIMIILSSISLRRKKYDSI